MKIKLPENTALNLFAPRKREESSETVEVEGRFLVSEYFERMFLQAFSSSDSSLIREGKQSRKKCNKRNN